MFLLWTKYACYCEMTHLYTKYVGLSSDKGVIHTSAALPLALASTPGRRHVGYGDSSLLGGSVQSAPFIDYECDIGCSAGHSTSKQTL